MMSNEPEPVRTAKDIAEALGRSPTEPGVGKLAAALAETISADITEQEACEILAALPGAYWVQAQCGVWYIHGNPHGDRSVRCTATMHGVSSFERYHSGDKPTMREAVDAVVSKHAERHKQDIRKATIAARIEREMAEADAAEKALAETAPLAFVPDGSGADSLPIVDAVDREKGPEYLRDAKTAGLVHHDDQAWRDQHEREIERIDEWHAKKEDRAADFDAGQE